MDSQTCAYVASKEDPERWHGENSLEFGLDRDPEQSGPWNSLLGGLGISEWRCPHPPLGQENGDEKFCIFHTETEVSADSQRKELLEALEEAGDGPWDDRPEHRGQFVGATFGAINLSGETISATDDYGIRFDHARFQTKDDHLEFKDTTFITHGQNPVSFNRAEFITDGDGDVKFDDATFRTYHDGNVGFGTATFRADGNGHVSFNDATFTAHGDGSVGFGDSMFETTGNGNVKFGGSRFETTGNGNVRFDNTTFRTTGNSDMWFGEATFRTESDGNVRFDEATFKATGDGDVWFGETTFRTTGDGDVWFGETTFRIDGKVGFGGVTFRPDGCVVFDDAVFRTDGNGSVGFDNATFRIGGDGSVRFGGATLTNTNFRNVDFGEADLGGAELAGTDLREANIAGVSVNGATTCRRLYEGSQFGTEELDATARSYHDLKTVFSSHGLVGKARSMHVQERRTRSREAKAAYGRFDYRYLRSLPSRFITGYGIQPRKLGCWMLFLFMVSTLTYIHVGVNDTVVENVSYSVLTFTVAPPHVPEGIETQLVMMVETFFGTLSIVLLGYILGNRERF